MMNNCFLFAIMNRIYVLSMCTQEGDTLYTYTIYLEQHTSMIYYSHIKLKVIKKLNSIKWKIYPKNTKIILINHNAYYDNV